MVAIMSTPKFKQSKNRKKYWKKHVNLKDIEEFLEEKRHDERFGGPVADKPNSDLFVVQTKGSRKYVSPAERGVPVQLRCFQILQPDSAVPPPMKPPQLQGQAKVTSTARTNQSEAKGHRVKTNSNTEQAQGKDKNTIFDLWSTDDINSKKKEVRDVEVDYLPDIVLRKKVKVPEYRYQRPSLLPAVETPHAGASYNPTLKDHQELLLEAHSTEVKRQRQEERLDRQLASKFPKQMPTQESWLEEMSAGLFDDADDRRGDIEEDEDEMDESTAAKTWGKPVSFLEAKVKAERNLEKIRKREKRKVLLEKEQKRRLNDLNGVKALKKKIVKAEEESKVRIKKREHQLAESMYRPRRLGPCRYVAPDVEVQLGEELADNLRTMKVEGHLMEDRFYSFQRRNMLEPRQRQKIPKKKVKRLLRKTHKD